MKSTTSALVVFLFALSLDAIAMEITRDEACDDQGGHVVADTGAVGVFDPDHKCPDSNKPPTNLAVPAEGELWPEHVEVCCGGTGGELFDDDLFDSLDYVDWSLTADGCAEMKGTVVKDSGDGAVYKLDYICESNGFAPAGNVTADKSEELIGVCCLEPWALTPSECAGIDGNAVADTGDGAVYDVGYVCKSDRFPPLGNVRAEGSGNLIGVCCLKPWILSAEECTDMMLGKVLVDSGNGAIFSPGYLCDSHGFPPVGQVLQVGVEPTAVCCIGPDSFGPEGLGGDAAALDGMSTKALKALVEVKKLQSKISAKSHGGNL